MKTYLYNVFGLRWRKAPIASEGKKVLDLDEGDFLTADILPMESATFLVAQQLGQLGAKREMMPCWPAASCPM